MRPCKAGLHRRFKKHRSYIHTSSLLHRDSPPPSLPFSRRSLLFFPSATNSQHDLFLRDKPNLLSEIRRATHYGVTPEKQEVDDLRSEVGSLRLQVTDMDGRIDALSQLVDRLLEERSAGADGASVKHEIPPAAGWAKKRRLDGEWDGTADAGGESDNGGAVVRLAAGPPRVKMEAGDTTTGGPASLVGEGAGGNDATVRVKTELSQQGPVYQFSAETAGAPAGAGGDGEIIGGGALCRDSSFLRDLDNMSIGSVGSMMAGGGSLGPLELIDVSGGDNENARAGAGGNTGLDAMNESFFDIDFEAEITSMPGSDVASHGNQQQQHQQQRNPPVSAADPAATGASPETTSAPSALTATAVAAAPVAAAAPKTPEIAMPLASAALGAFVAHYAKANAVKEPANAVAAVAMDTSRRGLERTASLR